MSCKSRETTAVPSHSMSPIPQAGNIPIQYLWRVCLGHGVHWAKAPGMRHEASHSCSSSISFHGRPCEAVEDLNRTVLISVDGASRRFSSTVHYTTRQQLLIPSFTGWACFQLRTTLVTEPRGFHPWTVPLHCPWSPNGCSDPRNLALIHGSKLLPEGALYLAVNRRTLETKSSRLLQ